MFLHFGDKLREQMGKPGRITPMDSPALDMTPPAQEPASHNVAADALDFDEAIVIRMCFLVYLVFILISYSWNRWIAR